ncbi:MAG: hypothetical protein J6K32_04460 [Clostridia bacterium]|nr:hypothetical protein [Clostridia bacterium]
MVKQDTLNLLRECDAGVRMGVASIDDVLPYTASEDLKARLNRSKERHERLQNEIEDALSRFGDEGKAPNAFARGMSMVKTKAELTVMPGDSTIASLMTDGCGMGVKSLNKYLNEYTAADEAAKDITKKLIQLEKQLIDEIRDFL